MHTEVEKSHHRMVKSSSSIPEEAPDIDSPSGDRSVVDVGYVGDLPSGKLT